jgi:peptide/nickel transport system permease protein
MWRYLVRRILQGLITVIIATILMFTIISMAPGDPIIFLVGGGEAPPPELVKQLSAEYGLDRSIPERLLIYVSKVLVGDLGYSYIYRVGVTELILSRLPATALLAISTYILITIVSMLVGMIAARKPLSLTDRVISVISTILFSFPSFFIAQILILVFAIGLKILPSGGFIDPRTPREAIPIIIDISNHLILPLLSLTLVNVGFMIRISRVAISEALREDFIMTLRAIGMAENKVLRSAVRLASIPILTMANYEVAFLLSGALLVEIVYSWPGIGTLLYDAILKRDYPLVSGIFFIIILFSIIINLITDLIYVLLDPRIRLGKRVEA